MNNSPVSVEPLKWSEIMKFLLLRRKIEAEAEHLALSGNDRKAEPIWFTIGRMLANRKWTLILVAKDRNDLIGYISISFAKFRKMRSNAYLVLSVRSDHQNKGIGTKLIQDAEKLAHARGTRRIELEVFAKNTGAHKLFKRLGYEEEGRKRKIAQIGNEFDDLILMAKFL